MAFAVAKLTNQLRLLMCASCPFLAPKKNMPAHVLARHVPVEEAPYHCVLCALIVEDFASMKSHISSARHRARLSMADDDAAATILGRGSWVYWDEGLGADATALPLLAPAPAGLPRGVRRGDGGRSADSPRQDPDDASWRRGVCCHVWRLLGAAWAASRGHSKSAGSLRDGGDHPRG